MTQRRRASRLFAAALFAAVSMALLAACDSSAEPTATATPPPTSTATVVRTQTPIVPSPTTTSDPLISDLPGLPAAISNRIAFASSDGAIYTVRPDGTGLFRVSQDPKDITLGIFSASYLWPVWSPDARHLLITAVTSDVRGGFETSLLRVDAVGGVLPEALYLDVPGSDGIGGIPHYSSWSPNSNKIAVIANIGDGLSTFLLDRERGFTGQAVSNGSPVYFDWSADGSHMLVHTAERLVLHRFDSDGTRIASREIGSGSISYKAPDFSPATDEFVYIDFIDSIRRVLVAAPDSMAATEVGQVDLNAAVKWSPAGDMIAIASGERANSFDSLRVIELDGAEAFSHTFEGLMAFWWSPDGEKILLALESSADMQDEVELAVVDIASGSVSEIGRFEPSPETWFMMEFFDLYSNDHRVWSPDSKLVTFSGFLRGDLPAEAQPSGIEPQGSLEPEIWVLDVSGSEAPVSVGVGGFATWSPR